MKRNTLLAGLALLASGCAGARGYQLASGADRIEAPDQGTAEEVAELVARGREQLARRVPGLTQGGVEVVVEERLRAPAGSAPHFAQNSYTLTAPGRTPRVHLGLHSYRETLLHELTHALLGEDWRTLPLAAEEGLGQLLGEGATDPAWTLVYLNCAARAGQSANFSTRFTVLRPEGEPAKYFTLWGNGGGSDSSGSELTAAGILGIARSAELAEMTPAETSHVYGVGYFVVRRIVRERGVEGLHLLCLRAAIEERERVPASWLLAAADIKDDTHLAELALDELRLENLRQAFESAEFRELLGQAIRDAFVEPELAVDEFHRRFEGTLTTGSGTVDFKRIPAFRPWLIDNWDALRQPADG